ncbi:MAG TPA: hypothetical protein VHB21_07385, partial [Minicystis sp.]|nr:hypothetical protein [Minicystis sp.]
SVFVKHRQRRLTLKRFLPSADAAIEFAQELRRHRFHAQDAIFIVDESTGETVTLPSPDAPLNGEAQPEAAPVSAAPKTTRVSHDPRNAALLTMVEAALEETSAALRALVHARRSLRHVAEELREPVDAVAPRSESPNGMGPSSTSLGPSPDGDGHGQPAVAALRKSPWI